MSNQGKSKTTKISSSSRRKALLSVSTVSALIGSQALPTKWVSPVVNAVVLPTHAMTSTVSVLMGSGTNNITYITPLDDLPILPNIVNLFIDSALATIPDIITGSCLELKIEGTIVTAILIPPNSIPILKIGTLIGTSIHVSGMGGDVELHGTTNSAIAPTTATGTLSGGGVTGKFTVSINSIACTPNPPSLPPSTCGDAIDTLSISANHGHTLFVSYTDIQVGASKTYQMSVASGHSHDVNVSAAHMSTLLTGTAVDIISDSAGHTHTVRLICGGTVVLRNT